MLHIFSIWMVQGLKKENLIFFQNWRTFMKIKFSDNFFCFFQRLKMGEEIFLDFCPSVLLYSHELRSEGGLIFITYAIHVKHFLFLYLVE